ncbi:hypothetical protein LSG31_15305 [Fodinisporobacter ferrooxydans]|uniref:Uncharacterized protein n=1 Tax=Fodinisporobacter ferrooxydans TaxID=2901836 RepID=A0ABY4CN28_9BACL|nr:hypothetical protein LSG31_15305 [Alicyclobacillaceae bacterium MYW30-H2]
MSVSREELLRIVEILPEEKLPKLAELLGVVYEEDDEELTEEELKALELAERQYADGEYPIHF